MSATRDILCRTRGLHMKAVIIDDEQLCLDMDVEIIKATKRIESLKAFLDVNEFIQYIMTEQVDIAFLDILMDDADGISLAMEVKRIQPSCKIVFISSTKEFAIEAFQIYASGYLLKPITPDEVDALLDNIFGMEQ